MQTGGYRLVRLGNGSWSVRSDRCAETFHPVVGPVAEAEALYLNQLRLRERIATEAGPFAVWDVGLGAAGNALNVLRATRDLVRPVDLVSFDHTLEPLQFGLRHAAELGYFQGYESVVGRLASGREVFVEFSDGVRRVRWWVCVGDFPSWLAASRAVDVPKPSGVMFDAFSPATNPEMWTLPLFERLHGVLDPGRPCAMPTYSRSTMLRVTLLLAGFWVGVGRPTGEKEETTLAANTPDLVAEPLDSAWLRRIRRSTSAEPMREPVYRQAPLSSESWDRLQRHPQFAQVAAG